MTGERTRDRQIAAIERRSFPEVDPTAAEAPTREAYGLAFEAAPHVLTI